MSFVRRIEAGPLTTTFTPPPACATPYLSSLGGTVFLAQQFKCVRGSSGADILLDYSCLPREWNRPNGAGQQTLLVHSPGLVCPAGFTSACTISRDSAVPAVTGEYSASLLIYNALRTGEVAVGCCPSNFACDEQQLQFCRPGPTPRAKIPGVSYDGDCHSSAATYTAPETVNAHGNTGEGFNVVGLAPRYVLVNTAPPASTLAPSAAPISSGTPPSRLGVSAIAGIVVGAVAAVVIVIAAVVFLLRRRSRRKGGVAGAETRFEKPELDGEVKTPAAEQATELGGRETSELGGDWQMAEIDGREWPTAPVELEGHTSRGSQP